MKTRISHAAAFGVATGMAVIIFSLIVYLIGIKNSAVNYISYPIAITIAVIGVKKWREQTGGYLTYGQTYVHLILQTVFYSILITAWTLVFTLYIAPGLMEDQMLIQQAKMEERGMSAAEIEMAMGYARKFSTPPMLAIFGFLGNMIMIGVIHLIVAAVAKKDPPSTPFDVPSDSQKSIPPQA